MKYKFVETQGCTAFGFTVNDKDLNDIPKAEQKEIVDYLCEKMKEGLDNGTVLFSDIVRTFQTSDHGMEKEACEQCGDWVFWTFGNYERRNTRKFLGSTCRS